jgi:hypothetical protein
MKYSLFVLHRDEIHRTILLSSKNNSLNSLHAYPPFIPTEIFNQTKSQSNTTTIDKHRTTIIEWLLTFRNRTLFWPSFFLLFHSYDQSKLYKRIRWLLTTLSILAYSLHTETTELLYYYSDSLWHQPLTSIYFTTNWYWLTPIWWEKLNL